MTLGVRQQNPKKGGRGTYKLRKQHFFFFFFSKVKYYNTKGVLGKIEKNLR